MLELRTLPESVRGAIRSFAKDPEAASDIENQIEMSVSLLNFIDKHPDILNEDSESPVVEEYKSLINQYYLRQSRFEGKTLSKQMPFGYADLCRFRRDVLKDLGLNNKKEVICYDSLRYFLDPAAMERLGAEVVEVCKKDPSAVDELIESMEAYKDNHELYEKVKEEINSLARLKDFLLRSKK